MLADLQPRYIKLDMSLIRGVNDSRSKQRLIQLMVTFGDATGATEVAEGVETIDHVEELRELGADLGQGYFFSKPVASEQIDSMLAAEAL